MTDQNPTLPGAEARSDHDTPDVSEQPAGSHAAAHPFDVAAAGSGQPALGGEAPPGGVAPAARSAAHLGCGLLLSASFASWFSSLVALLHCFLFWILWFLMAV